VEAARRWIAEHDRYPQQQEWEHRAPGRPTTRTIKRRWGWDELMTAAAGDGADLSKRAVRKAYRLELLCTLRLARDELGRWPTAGEWETATSWHVSRRSYMCGSSVAGGELVERQLGSGCDLRACGAGRPLAADRPAQSAEAVRQLRRDLYLAWTSSTNSGSGPGGGCRKSTP
jgi:hypothetical protein